jgi:hypothetical protein
MAFNSRTLSSKELEFTSRAISKISTEGGYLADDIEVNDVKFSGSQLIIELQYVIESLQDPVCIWTEKESSVIIDYYSLHAELYDIPFLNHLNTPVLPILIGETNTDGKLTSLKSELLEYIRGLLYMPSFIVKGTNLGRFDAEDSVPAHDLPRDRFIDAYIKTILPVFYDPTVELEIQNTEVINYEKGSSVTLLFNIIPTLNDSGVNTLNQILKDNVSIFSDVSVKTLNYTYLIVENSNVFKASAVFSVGSSTKTDNLGNEIQNTILAQTIESNLITIYGKEPIFYGSVSSKHVTNSSIRANLNLVLENSQEVITLNTGVSNIIFQVFVPDSLSITEIIDLDSSSSNITSNYIEEALTIEYVNGDSYSGTLYTKTQDVPYSTNHRHQIKIS